MGRLEGKRAVVTAAGQGIGRAVADAFRREGADVFATDLDASKAEGLRALDVTDAAAIASFAADVGPVDILANIAGYVHHGTVLDCDDEAWDFSFDLNVRAMHRMIRAFLPGMLERQAGDGPGSGTGGSIVNMSSACSSMKGAPNRYVYGTTKAAVIGMTKSIAADFIRDGVRCNAICPGTVHSPSWEERVAELGKEVGGFEKAKAMFVDRQPMGRLGTADEIAALAVYLAGDESAFTTGTAIAIDGGWTL